MKKSVLVFATLTVALALLFMVSPFIGSAKAEENYAIEHVNHSISVMYNGYVVINDTITVNVTGSSLADFTMGFPQKYGSQILRCVAYSGSTSLSTTLNTPLENRVGFYGVRIGFPNGIPETFSVHFVLSNSLLLQNESDLNSFVLDFPAYPSLTQPAKTCNVSINLPENAVFNGGTVPGFSYWQEQLPAFTYEPASLGFTAGTEIQIVDVVNLMREIRMNEFGEIEGMDTYDLVNKASKTVSFFEISLPANASNPFAEDQFGRKMSTLIQTDASLNRYQINLTLSLGKAQSTRFAIKYLLPSDYLLREGPDSYSLGLAMFQNVDYYIGQVSVSFILPEGAKILSVRSNMANDLSDVTRSVFQETVAMSKQGVMAMDNLSAQVTYSYNPVWLSFRPTIWVWTLAIVGSVIAAVAWKTSKSQSRAYVPTGAVKLNPEHLRSFVDGYEEKQKILSEMESLETRVQKGKIPRGRYKVRRRMLEARLATLSRSLGEFKEKMHAAGGQYSEFMRQLEVAETEINDAEANVKSVEARHNRGEISLEAYRKLLGDYKHRKDDAETSINGILLRLREETR